MLLAQTLLRSDRPVTVIATGPLTNLAWALDNYPEVSSKIDKVLIMGASSLSYLLYLWCCWFGVGGTRLKPTKTDHGTSCIVGTGATYFYHVC